MKVGETASFTIAASGTDLTYQWQIDRNDGKGWVNIDGATATSYTTSTVNISCNGFKYKCVVSNSAGNVESNSATLTVQDAGGSDNPDTPNNTYQIIMEQTVVGRMTVMVISPSGVTETSPSLPELRWTEI